MEPGLLTTTKEFISGYWPHVSGGAVAVAATVGTANFAYIRRPKSSPTEAGPYFTEAALLSPPLTRPAYSDRMAYVLAEMSDLAYYPFEGQRGFVDDAAENAKSLDLSDDTNVREFLETFSTELMSGRRLQLGSMKKVPSNSGFALLDVIDINETQGFACKRIAENEPPLTWCSPSEVRRKSSPTGGRTHAAFASSRPRCIASSTPATSSRGFPPARA